MATKKSPNSLNLTTKDISLAKAQQIKIKSEYFRRSLIKILPKRSLHRLTDLKLIFTLLKLLRSCQNESKIWIILEIIAKNAG